MKLLLDTHAALWWLTDDERLGRRAGELIGGDSNQALLSAAVAWEVAVKRALGKLDAPDELSTTLLGAGARALPISLDHAGAAGALPWHHRDPFDRILVASGKPRNGSPGLQGRSASSLWGADGLARATHETTERAPAPAAGL